MRLPQPLTYFVLLFSFFCASLSTKAQEEFIEPPAVRLTRIPIQVLTGGVILVNGQLVGKEDSLRFILDTGSGGISLDSMTVKRLGLKTTPSDRTIRGIGGIRKVDFLMNQTLRLPGIEVDSLNFHINDYDLLTSVYGLKIDGIIGYGLLSRYIAQINYDSSWIELFTPGTIRYPKGGFMLRPLITTLPIMYSRVSDAVTTNARYYFDTGAGLCILLSKSSVQDSGLVSKRKKPVKTQGEGLGGKVEMELTVLKSVKIGPYKFRKVPTYIFEDEYNVTSYPFLNGLIGNDILKRFNVILNYQKREFHLTPNSWYKEEFDYSYTGLSIYFIENQVVVADVFPNSPAETAGFQPGDVVIGMKNSLNKSILEYKTMLQETKRKIRVIVLRNGTVVELFIKPRNISKKR